MKPFWRAQAIIPMILAGLIATLPVRQAAAERVFQRFWKEKYEEMEAPEVIEDEAPPLEADEEKYLYDDQRRLTSSATAFPGRAVKEAPSDPVAELAFSSYIRGAYHAEKGSPTDAIRAFQEAMEKDPENLYYRQRVAELCIMLNDLSRAESLLEDVLEASPDNYKAMLSMGEIQFLRQKPGEAKEWFEKVLEIKPHNILALQSLAQIAYKVDRDLELTKKYSQDILHIDDSNPHAMLLNAEASALTGEVEHAAALYERLIRYRPGLIQQMMEIARRLVAAGKTDDAIILYERAMLIHPQQDSIRLAWEQMLIRQGGDEAVREAYRRIVDDSKNDLKVYELYAEYLRRAKNWEHLRELRREMLEIDPAHITSLLDLAVYHSQQGEFEKAEPYYEQALAANPADPDTYLMIGEVYLIQGDLDKARPLLKKAMMLSPGDIQGLKTLAAIEEGMGNLEEAEKLLKEALNKAPADPGVLKRLGLLFEKQGQRRKAAEFYQQVIAAEKTDLEAWLRLARIYMEENDERGLDILENQAGDMLRDFPGFDVEYGRLAQRHGKYERSRKALERALRTSPGNLGARKILAYTYVKMGRENLAYKTIQDADKYLQGLPEKQKEQAVFLGNLYLDTREFARAENEFEKLVEKYPDELGIRELYLHSLIRQDKDEQALGTLNNIVREFSVEQPVETKLLRARIYVEQGDASRAVGILRQLLDESPDHEEVKFQLALAASELNDIDTAERYYKELINRGPPETNSYYEISSNNLGYMFARNDIRLDEAEKLVRQALGANPTAAYILDSLGWVYYKKGEYGKAREYLERAAELAVGDAEIHSNLGQLYETIGEERLAKERYEQALKLDPTMTLPRERRDALLLREESSQAE